MSKEIYRFKVGNFKCTAISDGNMTYAPPTFPPPSTFLFINSPRERLVRVLGQHNLEPQKWEAWTSPYICLLINTGEHQVLVDTGADGLSPDTGKLLQNLKTEAITPDDIDTVILTHGHPDHIGGNTNTEGQLVFSKARYIMWKDEWDFWTTKQAGLKLAEHGKDVLLNCARKNLLPLQDRVNLINKETEIIAGICAVAAPGHTPGHMALAVSSGGEQLLCISDVILHPIHLSQPEWYAAVDILPDQVVATRQKILKRAADERALVLAFHFPFPGLGHVVGKGKTWQWQPIQK